MSALQEFLAAKREFLDASNELGEVVERLKKWSDILSSRREQTRFANVPGKTGADSHPDSDGFQIDGASWPTVQQAYDAVKKLRDAKLQCTDAYFKIPQVMRAVVPEPEWLRSPEDDSATTVFPASRR